ncbi:MAG: sulfotransferase domain-containing protein, partial [Candidatus Thorarchaeota archaeon]
MGTETVSGIDLIMKRVLLNTIPKSGTNMFMKTLDLLGFSCSGLIDRRGVVYRNVSRMDLMRLKMKSKSKPADGDKGYLAGMMQPAYIPTDEIEGLLSVTRDMQYVQSHVGYSDRLLNEAQQRGFKVIVSIRDPRAVLRSRYHYVMKRKEKAPLYRWIKDMEKEKAFDLMIDGFQKGDERFVSMADIMTAVDDWI